MIITGVTMEDADEDGVDDADDVDDAANVDDAVGDEAEGG